MYVLCHAIFYDEPFFENIYGSMILTLCKVGLYWTDTRWNKIGRQL